MNLGASYLGCRMHPSCCSNRSYSTPFSLLRFVAGRGHENNSKSINTGGGLVSRIAIEITEGEGDNNAYHNWTSSRELAGNGEKRASSAPAKPTRHQPSACRTSDERRRIRRSNSCGGAQSRARPIRPQAAVGGEARLLSFLPTRRF